jgi:DNA polymerase III psi subunit
MSNIIGMSGGNNYGTITVNASETNKKEPCKLPDKQTIWEMKYLEYYNDTVLKPLTDNKYSDAKSNTDLPATEALYLSLSALRPDNNEYCLNFDEWLLTDWLSQPHPYAILITAGPGMGKTTLMQMLAKKQTAEKPIKPLLIRLADTTSKLNEQTILKNWIKEQTPVGGWSGYERLLLLLDGLDEYPHDVDILLKAVKKWAKSSPNIHVVLTSRPTLVQTYPNLSSDFTCWQLYPMTNHERQKWLEQLEAHKGSQSLLPLRQLIRTLSEQSTTNENLLLPVSENQPDAITRQPLLLTLLAKLALDEPDELISLSVASVPTLTSSVLTNTQRVTTQLYSLLMDNAYQHHLRHSEKYAKYPILKENPTLLQPMWQQMARCVVASGQTDVSIFSLNTRSRRVRRLLCRGGDFLRWLYSLTLPHSGFNGAFPCF